jgi:hypothetical protein
MAWSTLALAAVLTLAGLPGGAHAQERRAVAQERRAVPLEREEPRAQAAGQAKVDASKLPLNLARVQRQLRESVEREERVGATLRYSIDVFAQTPPLVFFPPDADLRFRPVPFSAPTHQDMLDIMTPQEFRSPVMNFGNLLNLFGNGSKSDKKK